MAVSKAFSNDWKLEWSDKQIILKQVWAIGRESCLCVGAIWKSGFKSANPPGGSWLEPVVNWSSLANCSGVKWDKAIQNHIFSLEERPNTMVLCFLSSARLYSLTPHNNNSNSHSSNMDLQWKVTIIGHKLSQFYLAIFQFWQEVVHKWHSRDTECIRESKWSYLFIRFFSFSWKHIILCIHTLYRPWKCPRIICLK